MSYENCPTPNIVIDEYLIAPKDEVDTFLEDTRNMYAYYSGCINKVISKYHGMV